MNRRQNREAWARVQVWLVGGLFAVWMLTVVVAVSVSLAGSLERWIDAQEEAR